MTRNGNGQPEEIKRAEARGDMANLTTLCYIESKDSYLMLHRTKKKGDMNQDKWLGVGGHVKEGESPEECLLREVREETGLTLTSWRFRGMVTFVSDQWPAEYMCLYTADGYEGILADCQEGRLQWVRKEAVGALNLWEGDRLFLAFLREGEPFFSLKLCYRGDRLDQAEKNGVELELRRGEASERESGCADKMKQEDKKNQEELGNRLGGYIRFLQEAERLKSVLRTAWTAAGRRESTAEHSWRLALLAGLFLEEYPGLDGARVLLMCLIHDLGEMYDGDVSAILKPDQAVKQNMERAAMDRALSYLPACSAEKLLAIWKEYNDNTTLEAHLVKALDKAETIIQHNQGANPEDFDYGFNLEYGRSYFKDEPLTALRRMIDEETKRSAARGVKDSSCF